MGAPKQSYVKRARISANAGPFLLLFGVVSMGAAVLLEQFYWPIVVITGLSAPLLQIPRQRAWLTQNDALEFISLAALPVLLTALGYFWLRPNGYLSFSTILQGLAGFFISLGVFHMVMKNHTLALADEIERKL